MKGIDKNVSLKCTVFFLPINWDQLYINVRLDLHVL